MSTTAKQGKSGPSRPDAMSPSGAKTTTSPLVSQLRTTSVGDGSANGHLFDDYGASPGGEHFNHHPSDTIGDHAGYPAASKAGSSGANKASLAASQTRTTTHTLGNHNSGGTMTAASPGGLT